MSDEYDHADPAHAGALHHVEPAASDLDASVDFWGWLLGKLGYDPKNEWDGGRSWAKGPTYLVVDGPTIPTRRSTGGWPG